MRQHFLSCTSIHKVCVPCIDTVILQDTVQSLGPLGPAAFVASMAICECIPFFPTQPLSIGAGLLFGAGSGAVLNLVGLCSASTLAFTLSRTAFRGFAEAVVKAETGGEGNGAAAANPVKDQIEKAQQLIENGGPGQQFTAILLLRLTPIVPFSASNYVLGLTPVPYAPFIAATIVGTPPAPPPPGLPPVPPSQTAVCCGEHVAVLAALAAVARPMSHPGLRDAGGKPVTETILCQ